MRKSALALAAMLSFALAQTPTPPATLEIVDVEATVPPSATRAPFLALENEGEIEVPLLAADAGGRGVGGVQVSWSLQNTGKSPVYVIAKRDAGRRVPLRLTVAPGTTSGLATITDAEGRTSITLNATEVAQAKIGAKAGALEARNLRGVAHQVDWLR